MKDRSRGWVALACAAALGVIGVVMVASPSQAALPTSGDRIAHWGWDEPHQASNIKQYDDILAPSGQRFVQVEAVANNTAVGNNDGIVAVTDRQEVHFYGKANLHVPAGVDGSRVRDMAEISPYIGVVTATGGVKVWNSTGEESPQVPQDTCAATKIGVSFLGNAALLCEDGSVQAFTKSGVKGSTPTGLPAIKDIQVEADTVRALTQDGKVLEWPLTTGAVTAQENSRTQGKTIVSMSENAGLTEAGAFVDISIDPVIGPDRPVRRGGANPALLAKPLASISTYQSGFGMYLTRDGEVDGWSNDSPAELEGRKLPARLADTTVVAVSGEYFHRAVIVSDTDAPEGPKVVTPSSVTGDTNGAVRPGDTLTGKAATFDPASDDVTTQWLVDGKPVAGTENKATFAVTSAHVDSKISFRTSAAFPDSGEPVVSDSSTVTVVKKDGPSVVKASGTEGFPAANAVVYGTFATFSEDTEDRETYWLVDDERVAGQGTADRKELALTDEMVGKKVRFVTVGYFADEVEVESKSEPVTVRKQLVEVSPATVEGKPEVGSTLKITKPAVFNDDSPDVTITHKWYRNLTEVVGEGETYTLTKDDIGSTIHYSAEAIRPGEAFPAYSFDLTGIGPVVKGAPSVTKASAITGFPAPDVAVKGTFATFSEEPEDRESYWLVGDERVAGQGTAEVKQLLLTEDMVGKEVRFVTVGYFADDVEVTSKSEPVTVRKKLAEVTPPTIEGAPEVGSVLKVAKPATFNDDSSDVTISHKWYRNFEEVVGEGETYTVTKDDIGKTIYYSAEAIRPGEDFPAYSFDFTGIGPITKTALTITGLPVIEGDPVVGKTVTAASAPVSDEDATIAYQWFAGGSPIEGATGKTLALTEELGDKALTVRQTASRDGATGPGPNFAQATSEARTVRPKPVDLTVTKAAAVDGKRIVGQTVTGTPATFSDPGATVTNYWVIDGKRTAASGTTLTLTADHVKASIRFASVAERAEDEATADSVSEGQVGPVLAKVAVKTATKIAGTAKVGKTLTATPATFTGDEATVEGSWWADGKKLEQAGIKLPLTKELEGSVISFRTTATRSVDGIDEEKTSEASTKKVAPADSTNPPGGGTDPKPPAPGKPATDIVQGSTTVERGDVVTLDLGKSWAGDKVIVMLFSTPTKLGTHTVAANGTVKVTIPMSVSLGQHRIAVYDATTGKLIGWQAITVVAGGSAGAGSTGATGANLPDTGAPVGASALALGLALLVAGAATFGYGTRRRPKHRVG